MRSFELAAEALLDLDGIWLYLFHKEGLATADRVVGDLVASFHKLGAIPQSGHRRADLTGKDVLFYRLHSYLVIFQPKTEPLLILGVLHEKRDVSRVLRQRA